MYAVRDNFTSRLLATFGSYGAAYEFARRQFYRGVVCRIGKEL